MNKNKLLVSLIIISKLGTGFLNLNAYNQYQKTYDNSEIFVNNTILDPNFQQILFEQLIKKVSAFEFDGSSLKSGQTLSSTISVFKTKVKDFHSELDLQIINDAFLKAGTNTLGIRLIFGELSKAIMMRVINVQLDDLVRLQKIQTFIEQNALDGSDLTTDHTIRDALEVVEEQTKVIDSEIIVKLAKEENSKQKLSQDNNFFFVDFFLNNSVVEVPVKISEVKLAPKSRLQNLADLFDGKVYGNPLMLTTNDKVLTAMADIIQSMNVVDKGIEIVPLVNVEQLLSAGNNEIYIKLILDSNERVVKIILGDIVLVKDEIEGSTLDKIVQEIGKVKFWESNSLTKNSNLKDALAFFQVELIKFHQDLKIAMNRFRNINRMLASGENLIPLVLTLDGVSQQVLVVLKTTSTVTDKIQEIVEDLTFEVIDGSSLSNENIYADVLKIVKSELQTAYPEVSFLQVADALKKLNVGKNVLNFFIEVENERMNVDIIINNVNSFERLLIEKFKELVKNEKNNIFKSLNTQNYTSAAIAKMVDLARTIDSRLAITAIDSARILTEDGNNKIKIKIAVGNVFEEIIYDIGPIQISDYDLYNKIVKSVQEAGGIDGSSLTTAMTRAEAYGVIAERLKTLMDKYDFSFNPYTEAYDKTVKLVAGSNTIGIIPINNKTGKMIYYSMWTVVINVKAKV